MGISVRLVWFFAVIFEGGRLGTKNEKVQDGLHFISISVSDRIAHIHRYICVCVCVFVCVFVWGGGRGGGGKGVLFNFDFKKSAP